MESRSEEFKAVVIGVSAGGFSALTKILPSFLKSFKLPIVIAQHCSDDFDDYLIEVLRKECELVVKNVEDGEIIKTGVIYIAPPGQHTLINSDASFSLQREGKDVSVVAPAIDLLFETAAQFYKSTLIGIVLTGASDDGSRGVKEIKQNGGFTIAQDPHSAQFDLMPAAAIATKSIDFILPLDEIPSFVKNLVESGDG